MQVPGRIRAGVQDLGKACISLTKSAGACQSSPGDIYTQRELAENARFVSEKARLLTGHHWVNNCTFLKMQFLQGKKSVHT